MKLSIKWRIASVIVVGVLLRIAFVAMFPPNQRSDYANYLFIARNLVQKHYIADDAGQRAFIPPGEPAFVAAGLEVVGDKPWTPLLLNLVCYIALSLVVGWLAQRIAGERVAFWSVVALAGWPSLVAFSGLAASEHPFMPLFVMACALPWVKNWKWALVSGVSAGLAALIRPSAMLIPGIWLAGGMLEKYSHR